MTILSQVFFLSIATFLQLRESESVMQQLVCPPGIVMYGSRTVSDWSLRYNKCYLVVSEASVTWETANRMCLRYGSRLVEPAGHMLSQEIGVIAVSNKTLLDRVWIGYNRLGVTGDVTEGKWSDGRSVVADVGVWGSQQPEITLGNCTYMKRESSSAWYWYMEDCNTNLPFVCQATPCPDNTFHCDNGQCIGHSNICNGENNCGDNSDERNCPDMCLFHLKEEQGSLSYPATGTYLPSLTCQWVLEGALGLPLHIQFVALNTEADVDFVEIWVGGRTLSSSTLLRRLSGTNSNGLFISQNNAAIIRFISDESHQNSGFQLTWQSGFQCSIWETVGMRAADEETANLAQQLDALSCGQQCTRDIQCLAYSFNRFSRLCLHYSYMPRPLSDSCCTMYIKTCPGLSQLPKLTKMPGDGGKLYATAGQQRFFPPLYPVYYIGDVVTRWIIYSPGYNIVSLYVLDMDLGVGDFLTVFDGSTTQGPTLATISKNSVAEGAFTSADSQTIILSTHSTMLVQFTSHHYSNNRGFLLAYQAGCDVSLNASQGRILSPGYQTGLYPNVLQCLWSVQVPENRTLTLTFHSLFSLEDGKDFIQVVVNNTNLYPGSGYTGSSAPSPILSSNGFLSISFSTSATGQALGFAANFSAGCATIIDSTLASIYSANYGQSVQVVCAADFVFKGLYLGQNSVKVDCQLGGQWNHFPFPTCTRVYCGPPKDITNGYLRLVTGLYSGDTATYLCREGFTLTVTTPIRCRNTGQWDPPPACISTQSCPVVQRPVNGQVIFKVGSGLEHGSIANFFCTDIQYELYGSPSIICQNGQWSDSVPSCQRIPCAMPHIANGNVTPSANVVDGQVVTVTCYPGFALTASATFPCGQESPPACANVNECQQSSGCTQGCVDTVGSYYCFCAPGYYLLSNGHTCADIDECVENSGNCDTTSGVCINTAGSYKCDCLGTSQLLTYRGQFGIDIPSGESGLEPWNLFYINHTCIQTAMMECPELPQLISNGYMLGEITKYFPGISVTYFCKLGYRAQGQTTLTCQKTGTWDATVPQCLIATCSIPVVAMGTVTPQTPVNYLEYVNVTCSLQGILPRLLQSRCVWDNASLSYRADTSLLRCDITGVNCGTPKRLSGSLPYTITSTAYGAQFSFACRAPLFVRVGSSNISNSDVVTCGADGVWDFADLHCEGPTCADPGTPAGTVQVATSYEEFFFVTYTCLRSGFTLTDDRALYCEYNPITGQLAWNGTAPQCRDTEPPRFVSCPAAVQEVAYLSSAHFTQPVAVDNVMISSVSMMPNTYRVSQVIKSDLQITYTAWDHAGNTDLCQVTIKIKDQSPPEIRCNNSITQMLTLESQRYIYNPLAFLTFQIDNSASIVFNYSVSPLIIDSSSIGEVLTLKITGTDPSGNSDSCLVQVRVSALQCVPWSLSVDNGLVSCRTQPAGGYRCDITCSTGYKFYQYPDSSIISLTCIPGSDWDLPVPVCTAAYYTNYRLEFKMDYSNLISTSTKCQSNYLNQLTIAMTPLSTALTLLCSSITPSVTVSAAANTSPVNITAYSNGVYAIIRLDLTSNPNSESAISQCASSVTSVFSSVGSSLLAIRTLVAQNNCPASDIVRYVSTVRDSINCQNNQEAHVESSTSQFQCLSCVAGWTSTGGARCSACSTGWYFDTTTGTCQLCPSSTRSQKLAARSIQDCYLHCAYGYMSSTGEAPCVSCPEHTYSLNRTFCAPCPSGTFTRGDSQGSISSCLQPCSPGTFSFDGLAPCSQCPLGFYQSQHRGTTCEECAVGMTTLQYSSTSPSYCLDAAAVVCQPNPCGNGTCTVVNHNYLCLCPQGYTGTDCQTRIRPCDSSPCYNGAFCINKDLDYECNCTLAHTAGRNCEVDMENNCVGSPCSNFGACQDRVSSRNCLCPSFSRFTNAFGLPANDCTVLRNPCQLNPCQNGGTCINYNNVQYKCQCSDGFQGHSCQTDQSYCHSGPCLNGGECGEGPGNQVSCSCTPGYSGSRCEVRMDWCSRVSCGLHATCVDIYTESQLRCICNQGYTNVSGSCQQVAVDLCQSRPCQNDGTCVSQNSSYQCYCLPGYEGANCQHNIDDCSSRPCLNGGTCLDLVHGFRCLCSFDTSGTVCQDGFNQCIDKENPCNPYGSLTCVDYYRGYSCVCMPGYHGINCTYGQTNCASFPCHHGATCTDSGNSYMCRCPDGYEGSTCQLLSNFCASSPCANGGSCVGTDTGFVCMCRPGYRGDLCEIRYNMCLVANPCVVNGSICRTDSNNNATCICPTGYTGSYCQVSSVRCQEYTCQNGGTCSDTGGIVLCSCPAGYSGSLCQYNTDDCAGSPCPLSAVCVDGLNTRTCVCADNKLGDGCYKDLSQNFDLVLLPGAYYLASDPYIWPLSASAITLSTWLRFTKTTFPGTVFTLYGLSSNSVSSSRRLVILQPDVVTLELFGSTTVPLSPRLDDGYWHHVVVTWDGGKGLAVVYVDNTSVASSPQYSQAGRLDSFGWLVLGGTYSLSSNTVDRHGGMEGRLSRLLVSTGSLTAADVARLFTDTNFIPTNTQLLLTKNLLKGKDVVVDYNSQLTKDICRTSANCRNLSHIVSGRSVSSCPERQVVVSERRSIPSWITPTFSSADPVLSNYDSGSTEMGWGYYGLAYTQSHDDGDTAVCTFILDNRRGLCTMPVPPRLGSMECTSSTESMRCTASCHIGYVLSSRQPLFYSCGMYGMFDAAQRILPFTFSSCTTCEEPVVDLVISLNYTVTNSPACSVGQSQLPAGILSSLRSLGALWQEGLCGSGSCSSVAVHITCTSSLSPVVMSTFSISSVQEILRKIDNSLVRNVTEVLTVAVVDDDVFSYSFAKPERSSLTINRISQCPDGKVLLSNCCIACGLGQYYNSGTKTCTSCPLGTYTDELGQQGSLTSHPCKPCPSGQTTVTSGAQALSECTESCPAGSYYNLTLGRCLACPVGFYSEQPASYQCEACPYLQTSATQGSTSATSCSLHPVTATTLQTITDIASTSTRELLWQQIILISLGVFLVMCIIIFFTIFYFRHYLSKMCPCLVTKVKPTAKTGWDYVDRFGETKLKLASYSLSELRARKVEEDTANDSVVEGSVNTNVSLQIPVYDEKLGGTWKTKTLQAGEHQGGTQTRRSKGRRRRRQGQAAADDGDHGPQMSRLPATMKLPAATRLPPITRLPLVSAAALLFSDAQHPSPGSVRRPGPTQQANETVDLENTYTSHSGLPAARIMID